MKYFGGLMVSVEEHPGMSSAAVALLLQGSACRGLCISRSKRVVKGVTGASTRHFLPDNRCSLHIFIYLFIWEETIFSPYPCSFLSSRLSLVLWDAPQSAITLKPLHVHHRI